MSEALTETIKTRVPPWVKRGFKKIARDRHLNPADIQREAFRDYLKRREFTPASDNNGKAVSAQEEAA